jgi:hypothetical protein
MILKLCLAAAASVVVVAGSTAAEPGVVPVPGAVSALKGCWRGVGEAVGKRVVVALNAKPILQNAMFTVDVDSSAAGDPNDQYVAHLIFGGADAGADKTGNDIVGFWADDFGGAYTSLGRGKSSPHGFEITYPYPDAAYVNRWRLSGDDLNWSIVERDPKGVEKAFATYTMNKVSCPPASL